MNSTNNQNDSNCDYTEHNSSEEFYTDFSYWMENVVQSTIGVVGIAANTIAIPALCSREMFSIFNLLLMFLAIFDNFFIVCQLLEAHRRITNGNSYDEDAFNQAHEYAFAYFLYPFHSFVLVCSMYMTVALALERYQAIWKPIEYRNKTIGVNPWERVVLYYVLPVIIFSTLINIPKWFEIQLGVYSQSIYINDSVNGSINLTYAEPTALRINHIYVVCWANIATLTVQGIIPLVSLCILNYRIYSVMIRRRSLTNRPVSIEMRSSESERLSMIQKNGSQNQKPKKTPEEAQRKANETKQAFVLFVIVLFYLTFHFPRFLINLHEFYHLDTIKEIMEGSKDDKKECDSFPIWALAFTSISHCLLTLNSSSNFFIYCFMSSTFRNVVIQWIFSVFNFSSRLCCKHMQPFFINREDSNVSRTNNTTSTALENSNNPQANEEDETNSRVVTSNGESCRECLNKVSNV